MKKVVVWQNLQRQIEEAVPLLVATATKMTWNVFPGEYKFILTQIINTEENFNEQRRSRIMANDRKPTLLLAEIMPQLEKLYHDIYDINLYIYKATVTETIFEIQYYLKSSLDQDFRAIVLNQSPMFHFKISVPHDQSGKEKFDINWEHRE